MKTLSNFINIVKDNKEDFIEALERRESTSPNNKHLHQEMITLVEDDNWLGIADFLKGHPYYKHVQLEGVCLVFRGHRRVKHTLLSAHEKLIASEGE